MKKLLLVGVIAFAVLFTGCNFEFLGGGPKHRVCEVPMVSGQVIKYNIPNEIPCPMELARSPNLDFYLPLPAGYCICNGFVLVFEDASELYIFVTDAQGKMVSIIWWHHNDPEIKSKDGRVKRYWLYDEKGVPREVKHSEAIKINDICMGAVVNPNPDA